MRGRVVPLLLLVVLSLSQPAYSQCSFVPRDSIQFRSSVFDVALDGVELWTATGYGVALLDRTVDPPMPLSAVSLPGVTRVVRVAGTMNLAYAGSGSRIYVLRKNNRRIEVVRSVDAGGVVNDIALTPSHLYAATSTGIAQFDLIDAQTPSRTAVRLTTSNANVLALAINGVTLYAADGDATAETFNISQPALAQGTGSLATLVRAIGVQATATRVYVSDGQNTDIFAGTTRIARIPYGSSSLASLNGDDLFVAGTDRAVRAVDFSVATQPVELFENQLAPTAGTQNRVFAIASAPSRLYVAAGDIGLVSYDTSAFTRPYPVRNAGGGVSTTSALISGSTAWVTPSSGGIVELSISSSNYATPARNFGGTAPVTLHDRDNNRLLTSSGSAITVYDVSASPAPSTAYTASFAGTVRSAVLRGTTIYAILADGTLWTVDTTTDAKPRTIAGPRLDQLARSGSAVATTEITEEGNTTVRYYADGNLESAVTRTIPVPGAATGRIAMRSNAVAVFTFSGINLASVVDGSVATLRDSNLHLSRALTFAGTDRLLELTDRALLIWDTTSRTLIRELALPSTPLAFDSSGTTAALATSDGYATVAWSAAQRPPSLIAPRNANRYVTKAVAGANTLYLFGSHGVDVLSTAFGDRPRFVTAIQVAGLIDIAASADQLFTLSSNGTVSAYSEAGALVAQVTLDEGAGSRPLALASAGGAAWVGYEKGCTSGGCEAKTLVLDPRTLAVTATMPGAVIEASTSGTRAYAVFNLPSELRVIDVRDPLHPAPLVTRAVDPGITSVAYANGTVYALGSRLYTFAEATLAPGPEHLAAMTPDGSQRIRIDGGCAAISGRSAAPELYALPAFTGASSFELPANVRSIASQNGRLFVLTDYSLESWSVAPGTPLPRRRATR